MTREERTLSHVIDVVLGVSCDRHDAAAALLVGGEVAAACEEERFTRVRHDGALPVHAVASCLATAGVAAGDVTSVVFYEKPLTALGRYLATQQRRGPMGLPSFVSEGPRMFGRNLAIGDRVRRMLQTLGAARPPDIHFVEHHRSHAAAAFYPSPFDEAAVLTVDSVGERATACVARGHGHQLDLLAEMRQPDSLGLLYSFATRYCGFEADQDEWKLMMLAPYGEPRVFESLCELAPIAEDGSVHVDPGPFRWFSERGSSGRRVRAAFGGPPRRSGEPIEAHHLDLAASVQHYLETAVLAMAVHAGRLTGSRRLCLAGGVALNALANGKIAQSGSFEDVWVQPAAGDAGGALGAALAFLHGELERPRSVGRALPGSGSGVDGMRGALLGPEVTRDEVERWLDRVDVDHVLVPDDDLMADQVAARLEEGAVVGWFRGRMELGPNALGSRSIIADPRSIEMRSRLNLSVKRREDNYPFAAAVLAEHAAEWFDLRVRSPYKLVVANLCREHLLDVGEESTDFEDRASVPRSAIAACTHVDGSVRVQTVDASLSPELHRLLVAFHRRSGVPILVNASFSGAEEPIVATPDDALRSAAAMGLDLLVLEHALIEGSEVSRWARCATTGGGGRA